MRASGQAGSLGAPCPGSLSGAAAAEAHYLRMWRLRRMSSAELRILLAGDPAKAAPWIESAARYGVPETQCTNYLAWARRTLRGLVQDRLRWK